MLPETIVDKFKRELKSDKETVEIKNITPVSSEKLSLSNSLLGRYSFFGNTSQMTSSKPETPEYNTSVILSIYSGCLFSDRVSEEKAPRNTSFTAIISATFIISLKLHK